MESIDVHMELVHFVEVMMAHTWRKGGNFRSSLLAATMEVKVHQCLHPQSPASRTFSQSRLLHRGGLGPCVGNSSVPE